MVDTSSSQLRAARPSLFRVAPLTYVICWGYAVINIGLGCGLFLLYSPAVPLAVANILTYQQWGLIFAAIGLLGAYSLLTNRWLLARRTLLYGLAAKAIWAIALIVRSYVVPQTIVITLVWLFFAFIQAAAYIYFLPKNAHHDGPAA